VDAFPRMCPDLVRLASELLDFMKNSLSRSADREVAVAWSGILDTSATVLSVRSGAIV